MRLPIAILLLPLCCSAQFRTSVPLVLAPTTVTDSKGNYVDGLTAADLILYDNNVPQPIQMDWTEFPISLVVAIQISSNSGPVIDKLGGSGILFTQLLAASGGETAVVTFSDEIKVNQDFTSDPDLVTHSLRMLRKRGDAACALDALDRALSMLESRPPQRRRIVLMIAEKRDRGSKTDLAEVAARAQRLNATIYWLTFSPFLQPFTEKPKTMEDLKPEAERIKVQKCALCPAPDDRAAPLDLGPGGLSYALGELFRLHKPDLSVLFSSATGGRNIGFLKKNALEETIQRIAEEVHRQYILSFLPKQGEPGEFHSLRVAIRGRPDLQARTRAGYWTLGAQ
jgi:VWFA-related protein